MNLTLARQITDKAIAKASELNAVIAVAVVDTGGHIMSLNRMDNAPYITTEVGRMKAIIAANFKAPTHVLLETAKQVPELLDVMQVSFEKVALLPGGFPITMYPCGKVALKRGIRPCSFA